MTRTVREYRMQRVCDVAGASGTGWVASLLRLPDDRTVVVWYGDKPSVVAWRTFDHALAVHANDGATRFVETPPHPSLADAALVDLLHRYADAASTLWLAFTAHGVDTAMAPQVRTPGYVFAILEALRSDKPLDFYGHHVPADVQAWCEANLEPVERPA